MQIIGHRGAKGLAPENTIAGFEKAIAHGVDEIELDVRVTKDGAIVVAHNPILTDGSGKRLTIAATSYSALIAHKPDLATLEAAIDAVARRVPMQLEIKAKEPTDPIVELIKRKLRQGWQTSDFLFSSKQFSRLLLVQAALPEIQKVVIEPWSGTRATLRARKLGTKRLSMNQLWLWRGFIGPMSKRGYLLSAYPLNNVSRANTWKRYGLYGVITDYPDRFTHK